MHIICIYDILSFFICYLLNSEISIALHLTSPLWPICTSHGLSGLNEPFSWGTIEQQGCGINTRTHVELIGVHGGPWLLHCFRFLVAVAFAVVAVTAGSKLGGCLFRGETTGWPLVVRQTTQMAMAIEKSPSLWALQLERHLVRRTAYVKYIGIRIAPHVRGMFACSVRGRNGCVHIPHSHYQHHPHSYHHHHQHSRLQ